MAGGFLNTPIWRSSVMQMVQLFVQIEAAHDTVDELGKLGLIQFLDDNENVNAFQRNFVNEVKRCDDMEKKLRFFEEQIKKEPRLARLLPDNLLTVVDDESQMDELESRFDELESELKQANTNQETLQRNYNELIQLSHVLTKDSVFFQENPNLVEAQNNVEHSARSPLLGDQEQQISEAAKQGVKLGFITGVMNTDKMPQFQRSLWRTTRGNNYVKDARIDEEIIDPQTGEETSKTVFIVFFQGERLQQKIKKICESFGANVYDCPDNSFERSNLLQKVTIRINDLSEVLQRSKDHKKQTLLGIVPKLYSWKSKVLKEKSIYHTMNLFDYDVGRKCLIAKGWTPKDKIEEIQLALRTATTRSGALVPSVLSVIKSEDTPPTHFETNKYTRSFQEIVNAYGVAHYREVNPAVLTIVTFPFLFGVMFGDVGHGSLLLLSAIGLISIEKKLAGKKLNELIQMPFDGRYVLFLMGLFSIYVGFIYNEMFSIPMNIFGSQYRSCYNSNATGACLTHSQAEKTQNTTGNSFPYVTYYEYHDTDRTYEFGVDPLWKGAPNELVYYNSFKMKLSILFGVIQMTVGICFSLLNYLSQKGPIKWVNIFTQFIPQLMFLWGIFGYMSVLIVLKWVVPYRTIGYTTNPDGSPGSIDPPFILPTIIDMFLQPGGAIDVPFFDGQSKLQPALLLLSLLSIPIMLVPKPLFMKKFHDMEVERKKNGHHEEEHDDEALYIGHHGDEFEMSEVFVHQVIHTIEFVLGAVSNTASYLRLWALSLAHSELSSVFWERILIGQVEGGNPALAFVGFGAWLGASVAVLLLMESLSAFLHALRLHWVEFQNKFYIGDGVLYRPYDVRTILAGNDDEE